MKIVKDGFIYLLGDLITKSVPFLLLPYLTRMMGAEGYGELSYYQVVIALGVIIIGYSQDGALTRYYYRYGKAGLGSLLLIGSGYSFFVFLIVCLSLFYFDDIIIFYCLASAFTQSILALFFAIQQCQKKSVSYIFIQLLNAVLSAIITILLFHFYASSAMERINAIFIANTSSVIVSLYYIFAHQKLKIRISKRRFCHLYKYLMCFGFPLIFHQLSFFAKGQLDRVLIYKVFSATLLGVYAAGYQIASILTILLMAINKATVPYYYEALKKGILDRDKVLTYVRYSFVLVPVPAAILYLIPNSLFVFILGDGFYEAKYFSVIFSIAIGLTIPYLLLVNYLFYYGRNSSISKCTIASSVIYIGLVFVFSRISIIYVPFSMIFSNILMVAFLYRKVYRG